jgi:hypothetical protein
MCIEFKMRRTDRAFTNHFHLEDGTMNDSINNLADVEDEIFNYAVTDEAIEVAAGILEGQAKNATIAFCSGLDTCPS